MKQLDYSLNLYWDARVMNAKTKLSRILLTVNLKGKQFRLSLKLRATKADFEKAVSSARVMPDTVRELKRDMDGYLTKAETIFSRMPSLDKETFCRLFKSETDLFNSKKIDVYYFFEQKMAETLRDSRVGTYKYYKGCLANLKRYKPELSFTDIDEKWLRNYQAYLKGNGNSCATIALRMRALQIVYKMAVEQGFVSGSTKPFKNIATGSGVKSKSVLYPAQLKTLWEYEPNGLRERRAKATFFFLYLANGMNPKDMAYLRWSDVKGDFFVFVREKTKSTKSNSQEIKVHLSEELKQILAEWGNVDKTGFVFPILNGCKELVQMEKARTRYKRTCNKSLAQIGKALGFEVHLCLNLARHSFATMHKLLGTPTSFISDAMGHSNAQMTEHYLKSLPDENLKEMSNKLLSFTQTKFSLSIK